MALRANEHFADRSPTELLRTTELSGRPVRGRSGQGRDDLRRSEHRRRQRQTGNDRRLDRLRRRGAACSVARYVDVPDWNSVPCGCAAACGDLPNGALPERHVHRMAEYTSVLNWGSIRCPVATGHGRPVRRPVASNRAGMAHARATSRRQQSSEGRQRHR